MEGSPEEVVFVGSKGRCVPHGIARLQNDYFDVAQSVRTSLQRLSEEMRWG